MKVSFRPNGNLWDRAQRSYAEGQTEQVCVEPTEIGKYAPPTTTDCSATGLDRCSTCGCIRLSVFDQQKVIRTTAGTDG